MGGLGDLHKVFETTAKNFEAVRKSIEGNENATREKVTLLKRRASEKINLSEEHLLKDMMEKLHKDIQKAADDWTKKTEAHEKNTKFREEYGDSLLLYIFGQVKSGKSSLGNFLIHGKHDPKPCEARQDVKLKIHDDSGKSNLSEDEFNRTKKFKIDYIEATSAIQVIKIPGLTLVDSPGLNSATEENGRLAEEYLACADLVLFLVKSPSYCSRTEAKEIETIHKKNKEFLIIVPRYDDFYEDEDGQGEIVRRLVMKSDEARDKISKHCEEFSAKELTDVPPGFFDGRAITISCRYAEENPDDNGWQDSGLARLACKLADIAQDAGVHLKCTAPLKNLMTYNDTILCSITPLEKKFADAEQEISRFRKEVKENAEQSVRAVKRRLRSMVIDAVNEHLKNQELLKEAFEKGLSNILEGAFDEFAEKIHASGQGFVKNLQSSSISLTGLDFPPVEDIRHTINSHVKNKWLKLLGALVGAVGGFLRGGPVGAAVGAGLGSTTAEQVDSRLINGKRIDTVVLGDTRDTVINEAAEKLFTVASQNFGEFADNLANTYLADLEKWIGNLKECFAQTVCELRSQNECMDREISNQNKAGGDEIYAICSHS